MRGYNQVLDDPDATYPSTPSFLTLKTLRTSAVAHGWHVSLADVSTAFLHALMDGGMYVSKYFLRSNIIQAETSRGDRTVPCIRAQKPAKVAATVKGPMKSDPTCISMQCARFILRYVDGLMLSDDKKAVADLVADCKRNFFFA